MVVSVKGAELFYSTRGAGLPCLVPCILGTQPYERLTPPPLSDRFQLVYVDLRGGGRSTGDPADLTFDVLASDFEAVRADLGVDRVAVLGYSIVGAVALEYGRRCPESVSHVILVGTPPHGDMAGLSAISTRVFETDASEERKSILRENLARLPPETPPTHAVFAQTPMRFFDARFDAVPLFAEADVTPALLAHVMGVLLAGWDVTVRPESLTVPTLIAHGRYDYAVPGVLWDGVVSVLPNATLTIFERSGHQPCFEEPDRFVEVVTTWMDGQRERST